MAASDNGQEFFQIKTQTVSALGHQFDVVYAEAGPSHGGVIIGIHGAPATHKMFKRMSVPLVEHGYRVILPNLPGMGWTPLPDSGCYNHTFQHKAAVVEGLIKALGIEEILMLCGHSMGVHAVVHLAALPSIINICRSVCFLAGPGVKPHKLISPWVIYKYASYCYYWLCHIPLLGTGLMYATSPLFQASGLKGKTVVSQVNSVYEAALFDWGEFAKDLAVLRDKGMGVLVVHGDEDWFVQLDIAKDNARRLGVKPENFIVYKDGCKATEDVEDSVLQRAMIVEGGGHFIFMKQTDILVHEQLSLLEAIHRQRRDEQSS